MNEENKVSIVKGKVTQENYEDAICTFIKETTDRKRLYVADDIFISDRMYVVTPFVTEALNRATRESLGIINDIGELIVPTVNSNIVKVNDKYVAVKTSSNIDEKEVIKSDPNKVQQNAQVSTQIKNMILEADPNARFVCDDYYGTYDLYEINGINLNRVCYGVSYIASSGNSVYAQTNNITDEVQIFGKIMEDPNVTMPVGALADVTDRPLDNLEVNEMAEVKDGAPDFVTDEKEVEQEIPKSDHFDISEIQGDLNGINNNIDMPELSSELEIEQDDKTEIEEEPKIKFEEKEKFKEPEEKFSFERKKIVKEDKPVGNLNTVVSAVKEKMSRLQDELTEKDQSLEDKDKELEEVNKKLKEITKQLEENKRIMEDMEKEKEENESRIISMESKLEEKDSKIAQYQKTMGEIYSEFSEMLDNSDEKKYYKVA